jgi:rSAM/selenodomain-associated transferase 2
MAMAPALSVVIPTWCEAPLVADAVGSAARIADQVIVADGGSPDGTAEAARAAGAELVIARKGRGPQLNAGTERARGEVLLFLHADARLPPRARGAILQAMSAGDVVGGGFFIRFVPRSWFTGLLEPANDLRRRVTRRYYGDAGIFVRAASFRALGGFRPWPLMHDLEFSGRMERAGRCVYLRDPSVVASARRFEGREIATLMLWLRLQALYRIGVSPHRLAASYPDIRGGDPERFIAETRARHG